MHRRVIAQNSPPACQGVLRSDVAEMDGLPGVAIVEHSEGMGASMTPWLWFGDKVQDDGVALVFQCVVFFSAIVVDNVSVLSVCTASEAWCIDAGCHVPQRH